MTNWPHRTKSHFVTAGSCRFHVQEFGSSDAPVILLVHGTGASTHSFKDLAPMLAERFRVVACDLPGHAFTECRRDLSLPGMAKALTDLLSVEGVSVHAAAGHSAGAAILLEMARAGSLAPRHIFGINAALEPIRGNAVFSPMARAISRSTTISQLLSLQARFTPAADMLLRSTGSAVDTESRACYRALFRDAGHIHGALDMMASWSLDGLVASMPEIQTPVTLIAAMDDPMVPASVSRKAAYRLGCGDYVELPRGGHLIHEVLPGKIAGVILSRLTVEVEPETPGVREAIE